MIDALPAADRRIGAAPAPVSRSPGAGEVGPERPSPPWVRAGRLLVTGGGLLLAWQLLVSLLALPTYLLPAPAQVAAALVERWPLLLHHAGVTALEILLGLLIGTVIGCAVAILMATVGTARRWLLPLVLVSQAVPVFALAPILVLWLGYGMASKVAMAVLIIFFPVASSLHDGLRRTAPGWLELARTMDAGRAAMLWRIRLPAALPALGSGLRLAAAIAPIGAVIGEWVGSSAGLGYLMLHANGRMQTDLLFAALLVLCIMALLLWWGIDRLLRRVIYWQPDTMHHGA